MTANLCVAVGDSKPEAAGTVVLISDGVALAPVTVTVGSAGVGLDSVACQSAVSCVAVGAIGTGGCAFGGLICDTVYEGMVMPIADGVPGRPQLVPGATNFTAVACSTATVCEALGDSVGTGVVVPIINGVAGAPQAVPDGLSALACGPGAHCVAVGDAVHSNEDSPLVDTSTAMVAPITNGVAGAAHVVAGSPILTAVACTGVATCLAVGYSLPLQHAAAIAVIEPINDGLPGPPQVLTSDAELFGITCPTAVTCLAVGNQGAQGVVVPIFNGIAASSASIPRRSAIFELYGVACFNATSCEAVSSTFDSASQSTTGVVVPFTARNTAGSPAA